MAQTLKFGNGTWATKKGSTLAYSDTNNAFKPLPFTYTGAGKGTRVNKEGLIEVVENDRPRIDYTDSEDGVFLLEKAATNYDRDSTNFTTSYMSNSNGIQSSSLVSENSPSGDNNSVYKISKVTDNSDPYIGRSGVNYTSTEMVFSVWLWTDENQPKDVILLIYRDGISELTTKKITLTTTPKRYFVQKTFSNTPSVVSYRIDLTQSSSNQYIYAWGKQVEGGNLSSYIPTQGTIQTRVQETASGSGNSEVFNSQEGVLMAEISANANDGEYKIISIKNSSSNAYENTLGIMYTNLSNQLLAVYRVGTSSLVLLTYDINSSMTNSKVCFKYKSGDFAMWVDGFEVGQSSNTTMLPNGTLSEILFSRSDNISPFYGKTKEIAYYDDSFNRP